MKALRGWLGERIADLTMWIFLEKKTYHTFRNVIVPSSNGTTQIDHILVSPFGLFVIETKTMRGWIFGSPEQQKWTQSIYGRKYSFQNPIKQNFRHIKCLSEYLELDQGTLLSIIVFVGNCSFKTPMPSNVLKSGLISHIRSHRQRILSDTDIQRISDAIRELKKDRSLTHHSHMKSLRDRHSSTSICPKCNSQLVERITKKGNSVGTRFLGCSSYPRCRYIGRV